MSTTGLEYYYDVAHNGLDSHNEWNVLYMFCYLILPVWVLFREAPKCPHHTLPQGFFVHMIAATQYFLIMLLIAVGSNLLIQDYQDEGLEGVVFAFIVPFLLLIDYKQLFGYGWGAALKRLIPAALAVTVTCSACYCFGYDNSITELYKAYVMLFHGQA